MLIPSVLTDAHLSAEQRHVLQLAFNHALRKLSFVYRDDPICEIVARKVVEIQRRGFTNAVAIAEIAYRELRPS